MTQRERLESWDGIRQGRYRIVVGPRSAVFAPLEHIGLIVVDEEHDGSYKQNDPSPRFHGRDTAVMRAKLNDIPVVMGSATPSLES
jgi:primosomal protein N' (replication factor Y)